MSGSAITLRPANAHDYPMALELYLTTMAPMTADLMHWDRTKQCASFQQQWQLEEIKVIVKESENVGWLQVGPAERGVELRQFFIMPARQRQGIGTEIMQRLIAQWREQQTLPARLTVLKNNPARSLYETFGFQIIGDIGVKYLMQLER